VIPAATLAVIVWGALAFGAVYPWAFWPLLAACAIVGVAARTAHRRRQMPADARAVVLALVGVLGATALQVVPLPAPLLARVSPSTDAFLADFDLNYAFGSVPDAAASSGPAPARHPISIAPRATHVALAFVAALTLFFAGLVRALSPSRTRRLAGLIVAFGVVLAIIGIAQKAMLGDHVWAGMKIYGFWTPASLLTTPFGPFVNRNHFAGWMLMAVPLAIGFAIGTAEQSGRRSTGARAALLWLSSPAGGRMQLTLIAAFVMSASLLMTRSRSGAGCLFAALVLLSLAARPRFRSARAGWTTLASLAAVFVIVLTLAGGGVGARLTNGVDAVELRKNIWADSGAVARDFPVTGTGLNTFGTAMLAYQTTQRDQHFQEAHNDYLQLAVEGGLLVGLPALAAIALAVRGVRRRFAAAEDDAMTYWIRAGAAAGLVAVALQAFVEFSLQMPGNAVLFVALLAIAMHGSMRKRPVPVSSVPEQP
jgi:putative inorganic carbon (HCO3(-)) transporter